MFHGTSSQLKDSIKGLLREVIYDADELVFHFNTVADEMFFIMTGTVELLTFEEDGSENVEAKVGSGGAVGVLASYFGMRHTYTARARSLTRCLRLVRTQLMQILDVYPDDEELTAKNAMNDFRKIKHSRIFGAATGANPSGHSVASSRQGGGHSHAASSRRSSARQSNRSSAWQSQSSSKGRHNIKKLNRIGGQTSEDETEEEGGSEKTFNTGSGQSDHSVKAKGAADEPGKVSRGGGMAETLNILHQRRKVEHVSAFCLAAAQGQVGKLERSIRYGVHVDDTDSNGRCALHCAASEGQAAAVKYLIEAKASLNIKDKYENTPLNDAVRQKHDAVAAELRRGGAYALTMPGFKMGVQMCISAFNGDLKQLKRMLNNDVDVNSMDYDSRTALHLASSAGHTSVVQFLLKMNVDVNCRDRFGFSPLADAVRHEHKDVQQVLLAAGGKLLGIDEAVDLCTAAAAGNVQKLISLIQGRADPNAKDYDGRTALHLAASNGHSAVLDYLLNQLPEALQGSHGPIDLCPKDHLGFTPLDDAIRHQKTVAIAMLTAVDTGALNFKQFSALPVNRGRSEQGLRQIFSSLDDNHDEMIDRNEFMKLDLHMTQSMLDLRKSETNRPNNRSYNVNMALPERVKAQELTEIARSASVAAETRRKADDEAVQKAMAAAKEAAKLKADAEAALARVRRQLDSLDVLTGVFDADLERLEKEATFAKENLKEATIAFCKAEQQLQETAARAVESDNAADSALEGLGEARQQLQVTEAVAVKADNVVGRALEDLEEAEEENEALRAFAALRALSRSTRTLLAQNAPSVLTPNTEADVELSIVPQGEKGTGARQPSRAPALRRDEADAGLATEAMANLEGIEFLRELEAFRESKLIREQRRGQVDETVEDSPEAKARIWIRGRIGKLLPDNLRDLNEVTHMLMEEFTYINETVDKWLPTLSAWRSSHFYDMELSDEEALRKSLQSPEFRRMVLLATHILKWSEQWRMAANASSVIMSEDMPNCEAIHIFSKQYKDEVKNVLEMFRFCSKALHFMNFLLLKVPEVRRIEELSKSDGKQALSRSQLQNSAQ